MMRPWPVSYVEINFHTETEGSETKCLLGEKEYAWIDTRAGSERQSGPDESLSHFYGGISPGFPLVNHLALPGSESILGLSLGPPTCKSISQSR